MDTMLKKTIFLLATLCSQLWAFAQKPELVVPIGHTTGIQRVACTPDEKYYATGDAQGLVKIWTASGKEIQTLRCDSGFVAGLAFSPDGKYALAAAGATARVWDWRSGKSILSLSGHSEPLLAAGFSSDGKYILTGSGDQTVKIWDRSSGKTIHTLQLPEATLLTAAFSPDGRMVMGLYKLTASDDPDQTAGRVVLWDRASGEQLQAYPCDGFTKLAVFTPDSKNILLGPPFKLMAVETGAEVRDLGSLDRSVKAMAIAPDGRYLLTGHQEEALRDGLRNCKATLWDVASGKKLHELKHSRSVNAVAFAGEVAFTGCEDGGAQRWQAETGAWLGACSGHCQPVVDAAYAPDGRAVLIGAGTHAQWWNLDEPTVRYLSYDERAVTTVAFAPSEGGNLAVIGGDDIRPAIFDKTGKLVKNLGKNHLEMMTSGQSASGDERIGDLITSPDGKYALVAYTADWKADLYEIKSGKKVAGYTAPESAFWRMAFSPDSKQILTVSERLAQVWDLAGAEQQKFDIPDGMNVRTCAFSPEGKALLQGLSGGRFKQWDMNGKEIPGGKETRGALSPNGKYRIAPADDNSAKIWDAASGQLIATLVGVDDRDWVVTAPSGMFDASPGAMSLMYFKVGDEAVALEQLKERYYEPGLLAKLLGFSTTELRDVALFDKVALYPEISANIEEDVLHARLNARSGGIGKLSLFVNGKQMLADANPGHLTTLSIALDSFATQYRSDTANTIGLVAYNSGDWLKSEAFELPYRPTGARGGGGAGGAKPAACGSVKPNLYLVVVGTSKYNDATKNLTYPDLDAAEMAKALGSTGKLLFGSQVQLTHLSTAGGEVAISSKANIKAAFADIAQKATPCDVVVVYFSGHGDTWGKTADKTNFYYLTKDITSAKLADDKVREAYAVSDAELTKWLTAIPAQKQVLILDACHSGKAAENLSGTGLRELNASQIIALELLKDRTGTFILTGSAADMVSYEASKYGQGLLTYSLLEGISGIALKDGKYVDVMTLFQHARNSVPKLAESIKQVQTPVIAAPKSGASFPIGIKDKSVSISLPTPKPVVIRCNVQDRDNFDDNLGLGQALNDYFHGQNAKGAQAKLVYYDVAKFDDGYAIKGNYTVSGETVAFNGKLFKGETPVGSAFKVNGTKDVGELVKLILAEAGPQIK